MNKEDKQLLLKDLSARSIYGVKCLVSFNDGTKDIMTLKSSLPNSFGKWDFYNEKYSACSDNFKPYLRPMSSMTEEEEIEYDATFATIKMADGHYDSTMTYKSFDWLNAHHFDYRGLIEKGLAIEVTEENNPYKD